MRIGVYGGAFDPVHYGHLLLAEQCREQCRLDEVWLVPAGAPPHKPHAVLAPGKARREMLELAVAGLPPFRVCTAELDRPGPHYTVETLQQLQREHPDHEWWLLLGADSVEDFPNWRAPERILELARIAAVNRGDAQADDRPLRALAGVGDASRIQVVSMPSVGLSATDIRRRAAEGRSLRFQTPRPVEHYIHEHRLYR